MAMTSVPSFCRARAPSLVIAHKLGPTRKKRTTEKEKALPNPPRCHFLRATKTKHHVKPCAKFTYLLETISFLFNKNWFHFYDRTEMFQWK